MARIRLYDYEVDDQLLPNVCMQCGADADVEKRKKFSWYPPWVVIIMVAALLPGAIVAMILTKRMTVDVPLCNEHKNHWLWRTAATWIGLGICGLLGLIVFIFLVNQRPRSQGEQLAGFLCLGVVVVGLVWLIVVAILHHTSIHPVEITDRDITLTNVSSGFIDALRDERSRHRHEDEDDYPRSRRRGRRSSDYDDEDDYTPPRRRSRRSAYDDEDDYEDE
jgi:hypothetical protein